MLLRDVVAAGAAVTATRSRLAKTTALAALLDRASDAELPVVVAWLSGDTGHGRLGVGWRSLIDREHAPAEVDTLTVAAVDAAFADIAAISGAGSQSQRAAVIDGLLGQATAAEQRFLIQLMLGELRQGALEGVMVEAIASSTTVPAAAVRRALMLSGSLAHTAATARAGGVDALSAVGLEVGRPLRPMLASPAGSVSAALESLGGPMSAEFKFDGARIQVHRNDDRVWVFTRTLADVTARVPEIVEQVLTLPVTSVVLDGETLALDDAGRPRPFQETMSRFGSANGSDAAEVLRPYFFDCLHRDGVDLIDRPLSERLDALDAVAAAHRIPAVTISAATADAEAQISGQLRSALADGHEGIMLKGLDTAYEAGRRGKGWQKIKPVHTLDLVVLAAEWGSGRRTGLLSNLHLGARDPDGGDPIMVGKTFKGLTDALLRWQTDTFPDYARDPSESGHVVWLRPELVVEIALDGVQVSRRYPGGVALRFARVVRYRPDRTAADADTIDAVRALLPKRAN
ncbi:ATP-dependent DNA ligase [Gordonia kroppenstedtii]|uniref:ATP-dependent DNA ligase n=1 Tax=Jongsikchunia kroppenstedtii TaxID=1121721 RepID=UPI0005BC1869